MLAIATIALGVAALPSLGEMEDNGVGIIEFEFTGTADKAAEHYEDLGSDGRSAARTSLLIDYPYLVAYGLFLAGACVAVADRARRAGRERLAALGPPLAWGALGAAGCDAVENAALLLILDGHTGQPWPAIAFAFATREVRPRRERVAVCAGRVAGDTAAAGARIGSAVARLPYVDPAAASEPVRDALGRVPPLNIFRMMANADSAFRPWLRWGAALLDRAGAGPAAARAGDPARRAPHTPRRVRVGAARPDRAGRRGEREQVAALERDEPEAECFSEAQRRVLRFTTEVVRDARASEEALDALKQTLSPREIVELLMVIGNYMMVARVMATTDMELDEPAGLGALQALAAAHEAADGRHQLGRAVLALAGVRAHDAVPRVVVQQPERDLVQRGLHRADLRDHVDAVTVVLDHAFDAAHLALDPAQPFQELLLRGGVAARICGVSHAAEHSNTPPPYPAAGSMRYSDDDGRTIRDRAHRRERAARAVRRADDSGR